MTTIAEHFATRFNDDRQNWATDDGVGRQRHLIATREETGDLDDSIRYLDSYFKDSHIDGDPVRYEFSDELNRHGG